MIDRPLERQPTVLITGASSGIGLEFARQYTARYWHVIATHRSETPPACVASLKGVRAERVDVAQPEDIERLVRALDGQAIDVLINNAGVAYDPDLSLARQAFGNLDFDLGRAMFDVNFGGALAVTQALFENVRRSAQRKIVCISSTNGSVTEPLEGFGAIFYRSSKAALNRAMQCVAGAVRESGVIVTLMHPGSVLTEKNQEAAARNPGVGMSADLLETSVAVARMIATIETLTIDQTGRFLNNDGSPAPW